MEQIHSLVKQTHFTRLSEDPLKRSYGNCQAACISAITGIPLEKIPNFNRFGPDQYHNVREIFLESVGLGVITYDWGSEEIQDMCQMFLNDGQIAIIHGFSPRNEKFESTHILHFVVGQWINDPVGGEGIENRWELIHDPHPDNNFFQEGKDFHAFSFLVPIRPWLCINDHVAMTIAELDQFYKTNFQLKPLPFNYEESPGKDS